MSYNGMGVPKGGSKISYANGKLVVPDNPIIPFIEGDGTGRDIWKASVQVFDAAVKLAYAGKRVVHWYEVFAGEKAYKKFGEWLPDDTLAAIKAFRVAIKGPLTTPVGGGQPVLSVYQATDTIVYGHDLADYLHHEFSITRPEWAASTTRPIPFWGELFGLD